MSGFDPAWLGLREPADARARAGRLAQRLRAWGPASWRLVDLGCGTGANGRWLAPRLGGRQDWQLIDGDARLLARCPAGMTRGGCQATFHPQRRDLRRDLRRTLGGADAVTASALLDLVSEAWLADTIAACRRGNAACLFALSYDGTLRWSPADPVDADVVRWFNAHQRRDKGFGPALGPLAAERAAQLLRRAGYRVSVAESPWCLTAREGLLQRQLLDGIASAAREQEPAAGAVIEAWAQRRRAAIASGTATTVVGHRDILGLPAGRPVRT